MIIPCREIAEIIEHSLQKEVDILKQKGIQPKLVTFLLHPTPEQQSFVSIKKRVGERLGINFELVAPNQLPSQKQLNDIIQKYAQDDKTTGIIIQLPLPAGINQHELYSIIPPEKEIEGHLTNSHFQFPLSLAVLTGIKYIFTENHPIDEQLMVDFEKDVHFFQSVLQDKKIVIAGRGPTGGGPIGKALKTLRIPFEMTHSGKTNADELYKQADMIITATGKKMIYPDNIKQGVMLLNVGLRKQNEELRGDYDEQEIADIASYYTETPGGLGPLDVLYLYKNIIDAAKQS